MQQSLTEPFCALFKIVTYSCGRFAPTQVYLRTAQRGPWNHYDKADRQLRIPSCDVRPRLSGGSHVGEDLALLISVTGTLKLATRLRKMMKWFVASPWHNWPFQWCPPSQCETSKLSFTLLASFTCCAEADSPPSVTLHPLPWPDKV